MSIDSALRELAEDLGEIAVVEKCASCECLLAIAAQALSDVRRIPGDEARDTEAELRRILSAGRDAVHPCVACDDCLPVEPYRRFRGRMATLGVALGGGGTTPVVTPPACSGCDRAGCD